MNIENEKQLIKLLDLLGLKKLELNDQIEIKEKLTEIIESVAQQNMPTDKINEYATIDFADTIIKMVENRVNKLCESDTSQFNYFSIVNAAKNLNGPNAVLSGLLVAILAELTGDNKYFTIAKSLVSHDGKSANESLDELQSELYVRRLCDGLPAAKQAYVIERLQGITDTNLIDKQFQLLVEENPKSEITYECVCPSCGHTVSSKKACDLVECPECKESKLNPINDGLGYSELRQVNETSNSPFKTDIQNYQDIWNKD